MISSNQLPELLGQNLTGRQISLPRDLKLSYNILLMGFEQWHQSLTDSWVTPLEKLLAGRKDVQIFVLPILPNLNGLMRTFLNTAMRQAITEHSRREKTLVIYTDRRRLLKDLGLSNTSTILPMVVAADGQIIWRGQGGYSATQFSQIKELLQIGNN